MAKMERNDSMNHVYKSAVKHKEKDKPGFITTVHITLPDNLNPLGFGLASVSRDDLAAEARTMGMVGGLENYISEADGDVPLQFVQNPGKYIKLSKLYGTPSEDSLDPLPKVGGKWDQRNRDHAGSLDLHM